jgi:NAD(P)H-binding
LCVSFWNAVFAPRVLARREEKARALFGDRAEIYPGDLSDPASMRAAMAEADSLFLVNVGPDIPHRDALAARLAKEAGVSRIVKLSSMDVEQGLAIGAWHEKASTRYGPAEFPSSRQSAGRARSAIASEPSRCPTNEARSATIARRHFSRAELLS